MECFNCTSYHDTDGNLLSTFERVPAKIYCTDCAGSGVNILQKRGQKVYYCETCEGAGWIPYMPPKPFAGRREVGGIETVYPTHWMSRGGIPYADWLAGMDAPKPSEPGGES